MYTIPICHSRMETAEIIGRTLAEALDEARRMGFQVDKARPCMDMQGNIVSVGPDGRDFCDPFAWNSETEYGEPQHWHYLPDGTSIEVCLEQEGLPESGWYYTMRQHCSEEDFENETYRGTCGIIECVIGTAEDIADAFARMLERYQ